MQLDSKVYAAVIIVLLAVNAVTLSGVLQPVSRLRPTLIPWPSDVQVTTTNATLYATSENAVISSAVLATPSDTSRWVIFAYVEWKPASTDTYAAINIRRGSSNSSVPIVLTTKWFNFTAGANVYYSASVVAADRLSYGGTVQYTVTLSRSPKSGAGTLVLASIAVFALPG
jgi:hypothetical protein